MLGRSPDWNTNRLDRYSNRLKRYLSRYWDTDRNTNRLDRSQDSRMNYRWRSHRDKSSVGTTSGPDLDSVDHNHGVSTKSGHILHHVH